MRIHRRTAVWIAASVVVLSVAGAAWRATRPAFLREKLLAYTRGILPDGWEVEIDAVDYVLMDGIARVEGLRVLRTKPERVVVVKVPKVEAELRFAALFGRGRIATEVRLSDPEVLLDLGAEWLKSPAGGAPAARPRVQVKGGSVRVRIPGVLADGEEIVLGIESVDMEESRDGGPSGLQGVLVEKGLGRVTVSGEFPPDRQGIRVAVEKFEWNENLLRRLSAETRERLAAASIEGTFGDGPAAPAIEITASIPPGKTDLAVTGTLRPRGLTVKPRDHRYDFEGVRGDLSLSIVDGRTVLGVKDLLLHHGQARFQADATYDLSPDAPFDVRFGVKNLSLDDTLRNAVPENLRKIWDVYAFRGEVELGTPTDVGSGTFKNYIRRRTQGGPVEIGLTANLVDAGISYKGHVEADGKRRGYDWPVDGVTGQVTLLSPVDSEGAISILMQDVRGRHGDTEVIAEGAVTDWPGRRSCKVDITIEARDVLLDDSVRDCSPVIAEEFRRLSPTGRLGNLRVVIEQAAFLDAPCLVAVVGEFDGKAGMTYEGMPIPVEGLRGTVAYRDRLVDGRKVSAVEITGVRGTSPGGAGLAADGILELDGDKEIRLRVRAGPLLLDGELEDAIRKAKEAKAVEIWDSIHPSGPADLVVDITGPSANHRMSATMTFLGAYFEGWKEIRYPVADLTGAVEVTPEEIRLHSVRGIHGGREVSLDGSVRDPEGSSLLDLTLRTPDFPLDESARDILGPALSERLAGYFRTVRPSPGLRGNATVRLTGPSTNVETSVAVEDLRGGASPFELRDLVFQGGTVRYEADRILLEDVHGTMGDREIDVAKGSLRLDRGEGSVSLVARRLRFPADFGGILSPEAVRALEEQFPDRVLHFEKLDMTLSEGWRRVVLDGSLVLPVRQEGTTGGLGMDGNFRLDGLTFLHGPAEGDPTILSGGIDITRGNLDAGVRVTDLSGRLDLGGSLGPSGEGVRGILSGAKGRLEGRDLRDVGAKISLRDDEFLLKDLAGTFAGGQLGMSLGIGGKRQIEGIVVLSNARARELFAPTDPDSQVRGLVTGRVSFKKPRISDALMDGEGLFDLREGMLGEVPFFAGISGFFGSKAPEFTAAHAKFNISGDKLTFEEFDLDSTVLGIHPARGKSSAFLDGRLDLKLLPDFKDLTESWVKWPIGALNFFTKPILERIFTFYVRGTISQPSVSMLFAGDMKEGPVLDLPPPGFAVDRRPAWDF